MMLRFTLQRWQRESTRAPLVTACERLEPRAYRSATYSIGDFDDDGTPDLRVRGSSSKEHVVITEDPAAGTTTLWLDQDVNNTRNSKDVFRVFAYSFETFDVYLSSGDDSLEYYALSSFDFMTRSLSFDTGSGNDKLTIDTSGENNGLYSSTMTADWDVGAGNDTASIKMGAVDNSLFRAKVAGGSGSDTVSMQMLGDVTTSLVDIDINLSTGKNKLDFNSIATISDGANFFLDVTGGGAGSEYDQVTTHFANDVSNARLFVTANLNGGNDSFTNTVDLQEWDVRDLGYVRFLINGGDGNDTLSVTRNGTYGPADIDPAGTIEVRLNGGNGNDKLNLDLGGNEENNRGLFLIGKMIGYLDGGSGNDTVSADLSFGYDPASFGNLNLSLIGGTGNDTLNFNLLDFFPLDRDAEDDGTPPDPDEEIPEPPQIGFTYGPTGYVTVDGGLGTDSTTLSGTVLANVRVRSSEKLKIIPFTDVYRS